VLLPSSRGSLGPRSTAALAELQRQLLTMAVEKAALQRQLQHGRSTVEQLQEKVGCTGLAVFRGAPVQVGMQTAAHPCCYACCMALALENAATLTFRLLPVGHPFPGQPRAV
jgi:hypothetical protein